MIYLDYNATTPLLPRVAEEMAGVQSQIFGNASSSQHPVGALARRLVEVATQRVATSMRIPTPDVVWTSGATESLRWAITGVVAASPPGARRILIAESEHSAAIDAATFCERHLGAQCIWVRPRKGGVIDAFDVSQLVTEEVCLAVVMSTNNETGVINAIPGIAEVCFTKGVPLLSDITQSVGKMDLRAVIDSADILVASAHKFYGPKGVGLLIARRDVRRLISEGSPGGGRGGFKTSTLNHVGIHGASLALEESLMQVESSIAHCRTLINLLINGLNSRVDDFELTTQDLERLCNTVNIRFRGADAELVMGLMPEVAVSMGSACNTGVPGPSHVLTSMGLDAHEAAECLRISVGLPTTRQEIEQAVGQIAKAVSSARNYAGV